MMLRIVQTETAAADVVVVGVVSPVSKALAMRMRAKRQVRAQLKLQHTAVAVAA
jgi:hypothetical protein